MIELKNVSKAYNSKWIFRNLSLQIDKNEFVTLVGESGSGKTTLLNLMGLLERPDEGSIKVQGLENPQNKDIRKLRRYHFGYIFQNYALLEHDTVKNNILLASKYNEKFQNEMVNEVINTVGLDVGMLQKRVYELSGGEQQRLAIARVLLKPCDIIFADEPTGNLDEQNKFKIIDLLLKLKEAGKTIICVTHDQDVAKSSDRTINIQDLKDKL
ncbi:ABC transporter ATP-binding protein [Bacillus mycoides]|uniref:ABC transporter domain-containing protein n=1 Tax=Bacillus mycoides TaxID=1405 RepID=A0ABC9QUX8_BACMY|nr:ABC transporter ATP-binding protein [Bacillus mycoides]EJR29620.1 hypothetical protein III_05836 [Bacillus mycoides]